MLALKNSLGLNDDSNVILTDSLVFKSSNNELAASLNNAEGNQPLLQIIVQKKIASNQKFKAERSNFLPQIGGFWKIRIISSISFQFRTTLGNWCSIKV